MTLELKPLGNTGFQVTPICIGCSALGNMPEDFLYTVDEDRALSVLRPLFAGPVNFADTAAAYGDGESERRIGLVLREIGGLPPGFVLATKADRDLTTGTFTGPQMRQSVERSLSLLGLDRLQICFLHDPEHIGFEAAMAPGGPVEVLRQLQAEGIIQQLGIAGGPIDMMTQFVETDLFTVAISHNRYTLLSQDADPFWDICIQHGVAALNGAPYGSGILAKGPSKFPRYMYGTASDEFLKRAIELESLCHRYEILLPAAALQFSMRDTRITSTIVGVSRPERLAETIQFAELSIPETFWEDAQSIIKP
jgi:D-threo-aldose 1-dehydrogenase